MKIMLIGGGSGGHITPLLAVASKIKLSDPSHQVVGVCEKGSRFASLYEQSTYIDEVFQISAGKYRRYGNDKILQKIFDIKTNVLNLRDVFVTINGYFQAKRLLRTEVPDAILFKGGFVSVPLGLAAAKLGIPYITHDSDSTPGLANRIISKSARFNATGMPTELYDYPKDKIKYTGIPLSGKFEPVTTKLKQTYRQELGIDDVARVVTVVGGSLGARDLNNDMIAAGKKLISKYPDLVILHLAGQYDQQDTIIGYKDAFGDEFYDKHVKVFGFVNNVYELQGAADIVVTRAGATQTAELAIQALPIIIVPANLAGSHQEKNAKLFVRRRAALIVESGDIDGLFDTICKLFEDEYSRLDLSANLAKMALPDAAASLTKLILSITR